MTVQFSLTAYTKHKEDGTIRAYTLSPIGNGELWLENRDGEGMSIGQCEMYEILDRHFKESF